MMKVVIDARLSGLKHAGIGRYVEMLSRHSEFKVQSSCPTSHGRSPGGRAKFKVISINPQIRHYSLKEQVFLIPELLALKPSLVHFPHFNVPLLYNKPFVVTIHDLLWHEQIGMSATTLSPWIYWIKYLGYRLVLRHAVLKSKAVIVPSKWVKKKIIERFPEAEGKIKVIYEGVTESFITDGRSAAGNEILAKYNLRPKQFLIYTGSLYPHKNVSIILNVLDHLIDLKLVVACARNIFRQRFEIEIEKRNLKERVIFAGFVPDEELAVLYKKAVTFVFPSLSEGFGLPGLEAMAAGCPVISSNAGALPEIYGEAALYFDPLNEEDLIKNIKRIKDEEEMRKRMIGLGRERAKQFSWEKCATETLEVYARCASL